ncbi:MAG: hypothetical protein ACREVE_17690 [Gammaproteobacteria bacterium]
MFEPVSTTLGICWLGSAALNAYARPGSAISIEALKVSRAASAVVELAERSQALFDEKATAIAQLMALAHDCAEQGWDGNEACAIDPRALRNAGDFVRALPGNVPAPEFAPEPDGSISLDWIQSRHRLFSLSVGSSNLLAFAWLDGADRGHGVARFDGLSVPSRVLSGIQSILNHGNAPLRIA